MSQPTNAKEGADQAASLVDTALEWIVRLNSGDASAADQAAYEDWKNQGPRERRAAQEAERLWEQLGPALERPRKAQGRRRVVTALAGAVVVVTAALGSGLFGAPAALLADQRTGAGEQRTVMLDDGSQVALDAASAFDVEFDGGRRKLRLLAGQIHVQVAPDATRPFEVEALGGGARAVGTAFMVRKADDTVRVTVTEHAVRVRGPLDGEQGGVTAQAGQQARYTSEGTAALSAPVDLDILTAWRRGRIVFVDQPLGEVATELRRYRGGLVVLRGDELQQLRVTGAFDSQDTDHLLQALEATLPVRVRRLPWVTVIEPAT